MYSPPLQHLWVQAHILELHRRGQACGAHPVAMAERATTRHVRGLKLSSYLARRDRP
jgi:hypothetical protein